jgi:Flp pilus assembly protein TadD
VREASWETGELELRRAVALDPKAVGYRLDLALLLVRRERWDDAYAELKTAQALPIRSVLDSALMYEIGGKVINAHRTRRAP